MNIDNCFPSDYLKAGDLQGRTVEVTIEGCSIEKLGDDAKPVLHFVGKEKGLVLNKTNSSVIREAYGPETDDWNGKPILLRPDKTNFQGKLVDCLRVSLPAPAVADGEEPVPF